MPGKGASQRHVTEQIEELRRKLQLLEGERKAYYEQAEYEMTENSDKISTLRTDNKEKRKTNAQKLAADQDVVNSGLEESPTDRKSLKNKSGGEAVVTMNDKYLDRMNVLNLERYETRRRQQKLDSLKKQQQQRQQKGQGEGSSGSGGGSLSGADKERDKETEKELQQEQERRSLENRLDKSKLKCTEAEHIRRTYQQIKSRMEDDQKTFGNTLDDLEREVKRMKHQLENLKVVREEAERRETMPRKNCRDSRWRFRKKEEDEMWR